ncbi:MAG: peroxiredoxin [Ignavibacteria bacterium]|nr:peroxiredoxin [Ignavibacteria bacterium]
MALAVGTKAPNFTLEDTTRKKVSLSDYLGKNVILCFFPAAFTGVCTDELCSFQGAIQRLNNANAEVLAISADLIFSNGAFSAANGLTFPLLSDYTLATINAYGVPFVNFAGIEGLVRSERAVFVIDAEGVIRHVHVTENPGVEPDYDEIFAAVEAL